MTPMSARVPLLSTMRITLTAPGYDEDPADWIGGVRHRRVSPGGSPVYGDQAAEDPLEELLEPDEELLDEEAEDGADVVEGFASELLLAAGVLAEDEPRLSVR
ncbi:hypothetical protein M2266_002929 [Streptomyces sp. SPB162]|nr:hypothetical protein [Streptomyces sp. SPB162]